MRAGVEAWAADTAARWTADGVGKWMARARSDGSLVGRGGFTRFDLAAEIVLEFNWAVRDARTGRGFATELGRAALDWAVTHHADLPIVAFTEVHNRASRAVMERLGRRPAAIIRRDGLVEVHLWVVTPALRYPARDASHLGGIAHQEPNVGTQVPDPDHAERRPIAVEDSRC
ncbi:GNAT family N-acetyltransferase [Micromonosporaceae bacterium B7E4]